MSNNSHDPSASDSSRQTAERFVREILDSTQSTDEISPSGELYRAIARFHRRRGRGTALPSIHTMTSEPDPGRRRRMQADSSPLFTLPPITGGDGGEGAVEPPGGLSQQAARLRALNLLRGERPRMTSSDRYMGRHRALGESITTTTSRMSNASNGLSELQHAGRQLEEASENLRALLEDPVPNISSSALEPADSAGDLTERRRAKRRKLDSDKVKAEPGSTGFRYGKYGQQEPGKLEMEIVSCDGGIFQDHTKSYSAENVLKDNASVYCTKANRCNLVLRHQEGTVFDLKELVIKAPHSGYTAPVQEGMIFISMTSSDLLTRTANYQIQYSTPQRRSSNDWLPPIRSIRHNQDGTMTTAQARARRLYDIGLQDADCEYRTAQLPDDFVGGGEGSRFNVTTELSDSGEDEVENERSHERYGDESSGDEDADADEDTMQWRRRGGDEDARLFTTYSPQSPPEYLPPRLRRRETASNITLSRPASSGSKEDDGDEEAGEAEGGGLGLMAPHARFFIERDKSKCTVRFDPPVSGRFILLKMWSPEQGRGANIDIQSVVVRGWSGPRYFPAIKMR